jgi:hypothetical protein
LNQPVIEKLKEILWENSRMTPALVRLDSRLLHDFAISGEDAETVLKAFSKVYGLDVRRFDFRKYFYPEPHMFAWRALLMSCFFYRWSRKPPLTVQMLVSAAAAGRWPD